MSRPPGLRLAALVNPCRSRQTSGHRAPPLNWGTGPPMPAFAAARHPLHGTRHSGTQRPGPAARAIRQRPPAASLLTARPTDPCIELNRDRRWNAFVRTAGWVARLRPTVWATVRVTRWVAFRAMRRSRLRRRAGAALPGRGEFRRAGHPVPCVGPSGNAARAAAPAGIGLRAGARRQVAQAAAWGLSGGGPAAAP